MFHFPSLGNSASLETILLQDNPIEERCADQLQVHLLKIGGKFDLDAPDVGFLPKLRAIYTDQFTFVPQVVKKNHSKVQNRKPASKKRAKNGANFSDVDSGIGSSLETDSISNGLEALSIQPEASSQSHGSPRSDSDSASDIFHDDEREQRVTLDENWTLLRHQWDSIKVTYGMELTVYAY